MRSWFFPVTDRGGSWFLPGDREAPAMRSESHHVRLVPPSPEWPVLAKAEGDRFTPAVGNNLITIHHIGSTSIPGIWAKPVIDLAPEVRDIRQLDEVRQSIVALGYEYWGEYGLPGRRFCPRQESESGRVANLHCYQSGDSELQRHLAFRDYLCAFPSLAKEYEREKLAAQKSHPNDMSAYNEAKTPWIRRIEIEALRWVRQRDGR